MPAQIPYCGSPPDPGTLMAHWNLDPVLIAVLLVIAGLYGVVSTRARLSRGERASFLAGWGITGLALVSPLCALSVALFSARVGQHMVISLIGAPLVILGRPVLAFGALIGRQAAGTRRPGPVVAGLVFAMVLWLWHSPAPYAATFASDRVYWLMHITLFGSALMVWQAVLADGRDALIALGVGIGTSIQMGFLGAILTFAGRPLFADHLLTAPIWGYTPLEDQQLGGVLMWVPGCSIFVMAACLSLGQLMRSAGPARNVPAA